jgi:hypothetical protein
MSLRIRLTVGLGNTVGLWIGPMRSILLLRAFVVTAGGQLFVFAAQAATNS